MYKPNLIPKLMAECNLCESYGETSYVFPRVIMYKFIFFIILYYISIVKFQLCDLSATLSIVNTISPVST